MFRRLRKVLVAVSGGPDSLATLLVLRELGTQLGFEVEACHFDHQLRPDSVADLEAVRAMCESLEVECLTGEGDVRSVATQQKRGIEETARMMRYQFLAFVAGKREADCIATGHTADDQAETVLMRIVRGSGVRGIRGMLPVSDVPGAEAQRLIRPLLETRRAATEQICAEFGLTPLQDPSNADPQFTRNRVRNETLAALRALNPDVHRALIGLSESAREAFEPTERRSFDVQPRERGPVGAIFEAAKFAALPAEALGLVIERECSFYHLQPETNRTRVRNLQSALAAHSGLVRFGDAAVEVSSGRVRIGPFLEPVEPFEPAVLDVPGSTRAGPWRADVRTDPLDATPDAPVCAIDQAATKGLLRIRPLARGERIRWHGLERKVSDLFINEKIPAWERAGVVAVADSVGPVALFGATRTFVRDGDEPGLWIRLSAIPQPK
jgi:tRNA(Ile)-lysidine synthase